MAKLSAHKGELFRFLSVNKGGLIAVMSDGTKLFKGISSPTWHLLSRLKPGIKPEDVRERRMEWYRNLPEWRKVKALPSMRALNRWAYDSVCETTLGDVCEPDANSPENNFVSWLIALRLI